MRRIHRLTCSSLLGLGLAACSGGETAGPSAQLFGETVTSFAHLGASGEVVGVGVVVRVKSFENAAAGQPSDGDFLLEMPAATRDATFVQQLRVSWLASGHGPSPYGEPHFDLHFYRGSTAEVDAIDCSDTSPFPAAVLAKGYETPTLCVSRMGYHAWPSEDLASGTFTGSMILGYYAQKMVFLEPMITLDRFLERKSFELAIPRPASAGGAKTLYPSHVTLAYDATADAYTIEFDQLQAIE